jgi:acyl-CoA thioester hydrolase
MDRSETASVESPVFEYRTLIRERHLDSFGHVNNAQYLVLFEEARWEMITSRGYGLQEVQETRVGSVVLECSIEFKRELKLREEVRITIRVVEFSKKTLKIRHEIIKSDGKVAAVGLFTIGCFDMEARKLISPTPSWLFAVFGENEPKMALK